MVPWEFMLDDGSESMFVRYTFKVDGDSFSVWAESFLNGVSVLGRPTWSLDGVIVEGKRGRVVDYNPGPMTEADAREHCAWAVSQIRARSGEEFFARRQVTLPGVA